MSNYLQGEFGEWAKTLSISELKEKATAPLTNESVKTDALIALAELNRRAASLSGKLHDWDPTPHKILDEVLAKDVQLGDVILDGVYQIDGIARAEHRGAQALRFDLNYIRESVKSNEYGARLVVPVDHKFDGVKRYHPAA